MCRAREQPIGARSFSTVGMEDHQNTTGIGFPIMINGLTPDMWGVVEHENFMKMLDKMGRFDGLTRLLLIEYFYSDKGPGGGKGTGKSKGKCKKHEVLSYKAEAAIFTGTHREYGDVMVAPDLLEYVSKEVERDAAVLKQVRKAREES